MPSETLETTILGQSALLGSCVQRFYYFVLQGVRSQVKMDLLRAKGRRIEAQRKVLMEAFDEELETPASPEEIKKGLHRRDPLKAVLKADSSLAFWFQGWFQRVRHQEPTWQNLEAEELREASTPLAGLSSYHTSFSCLYPGPCRKSACKTKVLPGSPHVS